MDAGDVLMAILLIVCAGWIVWATVTSNRRAHESGNTVADAAEADGGPQPKAPPSDVPPETPAPTEPRASVPSTGRTSPQTGHRRR
jgi:hypothetical protein